MKLDSTPGTMERDESPFPFGVAQLTEELSSQRFERICQSWKHIKLNYPFYESLRSEVTNGRYMDRYKKTNHSVRYLNLMNESSRGLLWKIFLCFQSFNCAVWRKFLSQERSAYDSLREKYRPTLLTVETTAFPPSDDETSSSLASSFQNVDIASESSDPLAKNPLLTPQWFASSAESDKCVREIMQDVDRTFPEIEFFRNRKIQLIMLNVLYIFAQLNPDLGYRQGMHEILGPVVFVIYSEAVLKGSASSYNGSVKLSQEDLAVLEYCFLEDYIEHDSYMLFMVLMRTMKPWYDFNVVPLVQGNVNYAQVEPNRWSPIVQKSRYIQHTLLSKVDPLLEKALDRLEVESQIWGIRWIRLLFGREFGFELLFSLWDSLFAYDSQSLSLVDYVAVVMLIRIRNITRSGEQDDILHALLKYPKEPLVPMCQYVSQAVYLRNHPDAEGGRYIIGQYAGLFRDGAPAPETPVKSLEASLSNLGKIISDYGNEASAKLTSKLIANVKSRSGKQELEKAVVEQEKLLVLGRTRNLVLAEILGSCLQTLERENVASCVPACGPAVNGIEHVLKCLMDDQMPPDASFIAVKGKTQKSRPSPLPSSAGPSEDSSSSYEDPLLGFHSESSPPPPAKLLSPRGRRSRR